MDFGHLKIKTRLDGLRYRFDTNILDFGNENEARWGLILV
jgi:hypothetical protein